MKRIFGILAFAVFLCACATIAGTQDYIPIGPQDLSVQVKNYKDMPVFVTRAEIQRPWASLGLYRIKHLPNDRTVIAQQIERVKKFAASKGAQAVIINQYFEESQDVTYPITLAAYLVRYLDKVSDADKVKIDNFSKIAAMENIKQE